MQKNSVKDCQNQINRRRLPKEEEERRQRRRRRRQQQQQQEQQQQQLQQQQKYQKKIVVPLRGVPVTFCITSASPMVVQVESPVPVKHSPVLGGVAGRLMVANDGGLGGGNGSGNGGGEVVVGGGSHAMEHDYSGFLIDNIQ
ncbi:unnamed protein product [Rotaria sp. Silwood1]|nr:unnamed protein product [Rotaria sp. Silwood1]